MEFTGCLKEITKDWSTGQWQVTFTLNEPGILKQIDKLKDSKLSIKAVKYRKKRSLDANAYFHVLVGKIADGLGISKHRCKNILLGRYGQPELLEDDSPAILKTNIPPSFMLEREDIHCMPCGYKTENGKELTYYKIYRGSHTYDTKEMSILIDGTVQEAQDLGIDTITPDELARIKSLWGANNG